MANISGASEALLSEIAADVAGFLGKDIAALVLEHLQRESAGADQRDSSMNRNLEQQLIAEIQPERRIWRVAVRDWLHSRGKTTILDYRGGAGSESLFLARSGVVPIYYDVPDIVGGFASYRFGRHGVLVDTLSSLDSLPDCDAVITSGIFTRCAGSLLELQQLAQRLACGIPLLIPPTPSFPVSTTVTAVEKVCRAAGLRLIERMGSGCQGMIFVRPYQVDVIIPAYDTPEHISRCLGSVRRYTSTNPQLAVRVVLISDARLDRRVGALLAHLDDPNWLVLSTQTNTGFAETVDRGMALDPHADVVLLGSHTEVTPGWLAGLVGAAYTGKDIATVTALSNGASIYSWPLGEISQAITADELARIVTEWSPRVRPTIPTAGGSCIYIKREVLNKVGWFDESSERDAAEESDFCIRATAAGYRHILADDVFVWHQAYRSMTTSGNNQKNALAQKNGNILTMRFPRYDRAAREFLASGSLDQIRHRLTSGAIRRLARGRYRILYALHRPINQGFIGGTEFHVEELVQHLRSEFVCYVLYPKGQDYILEEFADTFAYRYSLPSHADDELIGGILRGFGIDLVHIQHLMGIPRPLPRVAHTLGIPVVLSIHDYFPVCPNYSLIDQHGQYCGLPSDPILHQQCLKTTVGESSGSLSQWRANTARLLEAVDLTIFFSEDTRQRFTQLFSLSATHVFPYGIRLPEADIPENPPPREEKRFGVCFLGYATAEKGKDLIRAVAPKLVKAGVDVHFLGSLVTDWPMSWRYRFAGRMFFHGRYPACEVVTRLQQIGPQLVCLLSPWPETFSRTLSEAWAARVPVIVGPLGAPAERVRQTGGGVVLPTLEANAVREAVLQLKHNRQVYHALVAVVEEIPVYSDQEMAGEYRTFYKTMLAGSPPRAPREDLVTAIVSYRAPTRSLSLTMTPEPGGTWRGRMALDRPEQMRDLMPNTVLGQLLGVAGMVYLRTRHVGWKETLGRPLRKLRQRLA